jgi:Protein of unknown function (DUF1553)/Protein of unknown function (DUF1549)/Concanavalin A-like lectin/glucanases superfamily/Planctomycete cytochrome C
MPAFNTRHFIGSLICLVSLAAAGWADDKVSFDRDIRPILSDKCYFCHGPDAKERKADLRLDVESDAKVSAIVAGRPDESELIKRILSDDTETLMPPPTSNLALNDSEKKKLRAWIEEGAEYAQHWAFVPPKSVALPQVKQTEWCKNELDYFVLQQLERNRLQPSIEADRETLVRRVTLDLTGLPPTLTEIDAFLSDNEVGAYERLVDRLLQSERYGERMAVEWLDVARYADTYGYQNDRYRAMWPWRDWVVQAFNNNLPYDQFITWQIAGDLLPNATREQVLATAFNRNHRQTNEGGSVEEEFRAEYVADRVNTFGAAFLGLTLECCRCHDHKYDPLTQRDYYQLASFFNSIDESGLYSHFTDATPTPTLQLSTEQQSPELESLRQQINAQETKLSDLAASKRTTYKEWRSQLPQSDEGSIADLVTNSTKLNLIGDYPLEVLEGNKVANRAKAELQGSASENPKTEPGKIGNGLLLSGEDNVSLKTGGEFTRNQPFSISLWINTPRHFDRAVIFHRSQAWTDSGSRGYELLLEDGRLSVALIHFYPGNAIRVVAKDKLPINAWKYVAITYDGSSRASGVNLYLDGHPVACDVVRDCLTKNVHDAGVKDLTIGQRFRDVGFKDGRVDEFKVFDRDLTSVEVQQLFANEAQTPLNIGTFSDEAINHFYLRTQDEEYKQELAKLRQLRDRFSDLNDPIQEIMVMRETAPRPTYILARGAYDAPLEAVDRDTPHSLLRMKADWSKNRLGLAKWLVDPEHPLTARVAVNRFWQATFGTGLVSTAEDFGLQGAAPANAELLDWLSRRFIESGWNVRELMKLITTSATYRQRSNPTKELLRDDPENRLFARGPSHRLSAEMIRDLALASSGLLIDTLGGAPVKPYQPEGLWEEKSGEKYTRDTGVGSHRRSLYTFWKRTSPPPSMMSFDATSREVCTVRRQSTLTPLQILVLLNDPQYVEAARALAERAMKQSDERRQQLQFIFRALTARIATDKELAILVSLFEEQLAEFKLNPEQASKLLKIGDHPTNTELDASPLAALTIVAEGLMTYDETVMKR